MATTALVVEILVAGLLASVWLLGVPLAILFPAETRVLFENFKGLSAYSLPIGTVILAIAYPLGWLINAITYGIAKCLYVGSLRREIFGKNCLPDRYENIKTMVVMSKECEEVVHRLNNDVSIHRITRAGGLNFLAFGIILLQAGGESASACFGATLLTLGLAFWLVAIQRHRTFYVRTRAAASQIEKAKECLQEAGATGGSWSERSLAQLASLVYRRWGKREAANPVVAAPNPGPPADG